MFDVIVVGGNLAGTTAAIKASEKGLNVALVESHKQPFDPAHCGEMLFDIEAVPLNLDKIGCQKNEINKMVFYICFKEYTFKLKKHRVIIFDRNFIENKLLEKVEKSGVKLLLGNRMIDYKPPYEIILDNYESINGKVIIDASGITCQVGRCIGIDTKIKPRDIGVCIQSRVEGNFDSNTLKTWFHKPYAPFGYSWLFPLNNKIANIGLGIPGGQKLDLSKLLNDYISEVSNNDYRIINTFRACVPLGPPMNKLVKDNVLITGDAARLTHSLSGGGIKNAILSGSIAGNLTAKYIRGEISSLKIYQDLFQKKISRLSREYNLRAMAIKNDDSYLTKFRSLIFITYFINRLFPNLFEKAISNFTKDEKIILESLHESQYVL